MTHTTQNCSKLTKEEFKSCFDHYFEEIRNFITYRCGDSELATDIVQEAFLKVWEKQVDYHKYKTRGLIYKIANDLWISHYRKLNSEKKYRLSLSLQISHNDTEKQLYYQELKEKYEVALGQMSEKKRMVFLLSRIDNLSYAEIAKRIGISVKAVEKRMNLALKELRKILNHEK